MTLLVVVVASVVISQKKIKRDEIMVKDMFTGVDNSTLDIGRVLGVIGVGVFCFNSTWVVMHSGVFDCTSWGIAFAAILGGIGGMLKLKETTEPKKEG